MNVAAVVLAAGFSRRLGRPKQAVILGGETLLARAVRLAHEAGLSPVFVVVNAQSVDVAASIPDTDHLVLNEAAEEGIASSIRAGIRAAQNTSALEGAVLMTCDQVGTTAEHLRALCADPHRLTGSGYAGKIAVPAYFPATFYNELQALQGDVGARSLLQEAYVLEAAHLEIDVDTEDDVARAKLLFEG